MMMAGLRAASVPNSEIVLTHARIDGPEFALALVAVLGAVSVLTPLVRAVARRIEGEGRPAVTRPDIELRLDRIEHAVEAVALEVERISEGQRFVTQLLSKREKDRVLSSGE